MVKLKSLGVDQGPEKVLATGQAGEEIAGGQLRRLQRQAVLHDQAIVERLEADGIQIARRTVAKYRDQLGVLSARMRKRV